VSKGEGRSLKSKDNSTLKSQDHTKTLEGQVQFWRCGEEGIYRCQGALEVLRVWTWNSFKHIKNANETVQKVNHPHEEGPLHSSSRTSYEPISNLRGSSREQIRRFVGLGKSTRRHQMACSVERPSQSKELSSEGGSDKMRGMYIGAQV